MSIPARGPALTVDVIIENDGGIVLVERKHAPLGWALPGGFVETGETVEEAARREAWEETSLTIRLTRLLGVYSDPDRDPRRHTVSVVYVGQSHGEPRAADDAANVTRVSLDDLPTPLCFDHALILRDYRESLRGGTTALAVQALNARARAHVLELARASLLEATGAGGPVPREAWESIGALGTGAACFVTLRTKSGELRGCIGTTEPKRSLADNLRIMTRAAALRDPRFAPVVAPEAPSLEVEVTILGPLTRLARPLDELRVGSHGLYIERGDAHGVLLPQVAVEHRWGALEFLEQTCHKAGLPREAWRDSATRVFAFEAEIVR